MKILVRISAVLAFLSCIIAGLWILIDAGLRPNNAFGAGIGLYFIGKAFFVGPMLLVAAERVGRGGASRERRAEGAGQ